MSKKIVETSDVSVDWKERRNKLLSCGMCPPTCGMCPPNRNENVKRGTKQFAKGWKDKTKARKNYLKVSNTKTK